MRTVIISLLALACTSDSAKTTVTGPSAVDTAVDYTPDEGWGEAAVAAPTLLAEGLDGPSGMVVVDGTLYVAEEGVGRIVRLESGALSTFVDGLAAPHGLVATDEGLVIADAEAIWTVSTDGSATQQVSELEPTGALSTDGTHVWWVTSVEGEGDVWRMSLSEPGDALIVLSDLDEPGGLTHKDGAPLVLESGRARAVWGGVSVDEVQATWSTALPGRDIAADDLGVVVTTESSRWPNPGWVARIGQDDPVSLCETPPEPARVRLTQTHVYFASKQGIGRVERDGGTFETVALRTSVGDFLVDAGELIWTDPDRGSVWSVQLDD